MALNKTYDECYEIASRYKTKKEFRLDNESIYGYASRNGWLDDYIWLKRHSKVDELYNICYDCAKKYEYKPLFIENEPEQYQIALRYGWMKNFYWLKKKSEYIYDLCYAAAKKYTSMIEFQENDSELYQLAKTNRFLKEYDWLEVPETRSDSYYRSYEIAQKYTTLKDFRLKEKSTYTWAVKNNWIDDYTWLERHNKKTTYKWSISEYAKKYTYENCVEISKQYKSLKEFKDNDLICYGKCHRSGWLKDFTWLENDIQSSYDKLDYETCYQRAKKCTSKTEMRDKQWSAFRKAKQEGWIYDYTWFNTPHMVDKNHFCVYSYEDRENMTVYIGLTKDMHRRHRQHMIKVPGKENYDRVKTYFILQGKDLPMYDVLSENLTASEAQFYENLWIETYKNHGWKILNKAKTGKGSSSLGSYVNKWPKDVCIECAKKYTTLNDFMLFDNGAYQACCRNGWLDELTWIKKQTERPTGGVRLLEINKNGEIVNHFSSITDARRKLDLTLHGIKRVLYYGDTLKNGNCLKKEE